MAEDESSQFKWTEERLKERARLLEIANGSLTDKNIKDMIIVGEDVKKDSDRLNPPTTKV